MLSYFEGYGTLGTQRMMVADRRRTDAFAEAIAEVVQAGDLVIDVGTGTGILAMLAARAGAAKVHAIDEAKIAEVATGLVKANGLSETVTIHRQLAAEFKLDSQADVLISEWLGNFALTEDMLKDVLVVRDRFLKPGGLMLPSHVQVMLAPIDDGSLYEEEGPGFWSDQLYGLDFSGLEQAELSEYRTQRLRIDPTTRLAEGQALVDLSLSVLCSGDEWRKGTLRYESSRDGALNGFAGWFVARLSPSVVLDTGPDHPWTQWSQIYMPFPPRRIQKGEELTVHYDLRPSPEHYGAVELLVRLDEQELRYLVE